jgi:flagellar basal-body rod modification protein FlgD
MAVNGVSNTTTRTSSTTTRNTGKMGKDEFLKLLVTQLKYQDPLNPADDKQFLAQMAQFSSLEQMQNLNASFTSMKAFSLMGKTITATVNDEKTGTETTVNGSVDKVTMNAGKAYVQVGGKDVDIDKISQVADYKSTRFTDLMNLIGKSIEGKIADEQGGVVDVSGKVTGIKNSGNVNFVALDEVDLKDVDVIIPDGTTSYKEDYLNNNVNKEITVQTTDANGRKANINAKLIGWTKGASGYDVKMSGVMVPVDNLGGISQ